MTDNVKISVLAKANLKALERVIKTLDAIDSRMAHVTQSIEKMSSGFSKADSKVSKTKKKIDATSKSMAAQADAVKELTRWYNKGTKEQLDAAKKLDAAQRKQVKAFLHVQGIKKRHMAEQAAIVKRDLAEDLKLIKNARDKKKKIQDGHNKLFRRAKAAEAEIAKAAEKAKTKALKAAELERLAVAKRARKLQVALAKKHFNDTMAAEKKAARESAALKKKDIADAKAAERKKSAMLKQRMALIRNSHRVEQAMHNARRARLSEMSGALSGVNQHLRSLSRGFAVMGIASTAAIIAVTKVSKDFEASLVRAATVTTGTGDDFESNFSRMSKSAIDLANETEHTAKSVGEGMNFMAMAGFNASDIISAMPTVAKLATAANLSMADSANIVTNAMAGFGITSDKIMEEFEADTGKVMSRTRATEILAQKTKDAANVLVGAFTSSNVSLTDLNESLKISGPVAKQLNIPIEDLAATIGLLGNVGVRGTAAGTGLKRAMIAMIKPSKQAAVAMGKLGISSDMIAGKDGFLKVVAALEAQRDKMKETGQEAVFLGRVFKVFAERAGPQMAALVAQGTQSLVSLSSGIEKAKQEDLASIIEERQLNTLSGAISKLVSNVQTFAKALGDKLLPEVKKLVKDFEDAAVGARNLDDRIKDFMVTAAKFGAVGGGIGFVAVKIVDVAASLTIASLGFQQLTHVTKMSKMAMVGLGAKGILLGGILVGAFAGTLAIMEKVEGKTYDIAGAFENAFAESTESIKNMFINLFQFIASMITWVLAPLKLLGVDLEKRLNDFLLDAKDLVIDVTIDDTKLKKAIEGGVFGELPKGDQEARRRAQELATGGVSKLQRDTLRKQIKLIKEANKKVKDAEREKIRLINKGTKAQKEAADKRLKEAIAERKAVIAYAKEATSAARIGGKALQQVEKNLKDKGAERAVTRRSGREVITYNVKSGDELLKHIRESKVVEALAEAGERQAAMAITRAARGDEKAKTKAEVPDFVAAAEDATGKLKSLAKELENLTNKIADSIRAYDKSFLAFANSAKSLDLKLRMEGSEFKAVSQEMSKLISDIEGVASGKDNLKAMAKQIRALQLNEIELKRNTLALQKDKLTPEKEEELDEERRQVDRGYTSRMDEVDQKAKELAGTFVDLRVEGLAEKLSKVEVGKRSEALAEAFDFLQEVAESTTTEFEKGKLAEAIADTAKKANEAALKWDKIEVIDPQVEIKGNLDEISEGIFGSFKLAKFFKGMEQPVKEGMASALKTGLSKASGEIAGAFSGVLASIGGTVGTMAQAFEVQIVAAFAAIGTYVFPAVGTWVMGWIGEIFVKLLPAIGAAVGALAGAVIEMVPIIGEAINKAAKAIVDGAKKTAKAIFDSTAGAFKKMADSLADQMDKVIEDQRLSDAVRMGGQFSLPAGAILGAVAAISAGLAGLGMILLWPLVDAINLLILATGFLVSSAAANVVSAIGMVASAAFTIVFFPIIAAIGFMVASIANAIYQLASVVAAPIAAIVTVIAAVIGGIATFIGGLAAVILAPVLLLFAAIAMVIFGVAGVVLAGLGVLTAALGGFFAALLFKDPKFADDDYVSQRGRAQDALSVSIDKIVMALDPLWEAAMPLVGLFDYLVDVLLPLADSFAGGSSMSTVLFEGFKMLAVGIGMLLLGIGYFVTGLLDILVGTLGNPLHQFMGNLMQAIAQGVLDTIAMMMRGLADMFTKIDDLIPGSAIFSDVTTGLNNAADDAEAAADGLVPDFDELNQSIIDGLEGMKPDLDGMHAAFQELLALSEEDARARGNALADQAETDKNAKEFGESLSNVPSGFKVALHRFKAMDAASGVSMGGRGNILDLSNNEYFGRMSNAFSAAMSGAGIFGATPTDDVLDKLAEATDPQRWSSVLDGVAATFGEAAREVADLAKRMLDPDAMPGGSGPLGTAFMGKSRATESLMGGNSMVININEMSIADATNPEQLANMIAEKSSRDRMAQAGTPFPSHQSGSGWWGGNEGGRG